MLCNRTRCFAIRKGRDPNKASCNGARGCSAMVVFRYASGIATIRTHAFCRQCSEYLEIFCLPPNVFIHFSDQRVMQVSAEKALARTALAPRKATPRTLACCTVDWHVESAALRLRCAALDAPHSPSLPCLTHTHMDSHPYHHPPSPTT